MGWNQFGDFIDLDPYPYSSNFVHPDPFTINADQHHCIALVWLSQDVLSELDTLVDQFANTKDPVAQKRLLSKMMMPLIASQVLENQQLILNLQIYAIHFT